MFWPILRGHAPKTVEKNPIPFEARVPMSKSPERLPCQFRNHASSFVKVGEQDNHQGQAVTIQANPVMKR